MLSFVPTLGAINTLTTGKISLKFGTSLIITKLLFKHIFFTYSKIQN